MSKHFQHDLEGLQRDIIAQGVTVDEMVRKAVRALQERDAELAQSVLDDDEQIDQRRIGIERQCVTMLALYQPVAADLRRIVLVLHINGDLADVADLAAEVAESAVALARENPLPVPQRLGRLAEKATGMVWFSLDAFFSNHRSQAVTVCDMEDGIEALARELQEDFKSALRTDPEEVEAHMALCAAGGSLRRIASRAGNIARGVLYLIDGEQVRHPRKPAVASVCEPKAS